MAAEEDKKFDAVLGGFLVNDLRIRAGHLHCPESDTLAAYHERSLLPEEMNSWKEHIVGCARCQAILAELEATDSIALHVSEKEETLTETATAETASEPASPQKEVPAILPEKSRVTPISRGVRWQWLVPAGAVAAGLLVWIAWHENQPLQVKPPAEAKTAKMEPLAAPPASASRDNRQSASSDELARVAKDQGAVGGPAAPKPALEENGLKPPEKSDGRARVANSELQADKEAGARADTGLDSLAATNREQKQLPQDAKAGVAGAASQTVEVQTLAADAQGQNQQVQKNLQAQNELNEQKVSGPNPSKRAEQAKKSKAESPALANRAAAASSAQSPAPPAAAFNDSGALRMTAAVSQNLISAPGGKTFWRVGHLGMVEFSSDAGETWSRQISNVSGELTAGFAPSEKVCWIVGKAGTVLLTNDAGAHWAIIRSPLTEDLAGVRATDALHATIWNLANTKIFETSDGGATWKPAAPQ